MMTAADDVSLPSLTFQLELFPETSGTIALFEDVMNVTDLKAMLINKELNAVMLSPKMVISNSVLLLLLPLLIFLLLILSMSPFHL